MPIKTAGFATFLTLSWVSLAAAGPVADAGAKAEALAADGRSVEALGALGDAVDTIWRDSALAFRTIELVESASGFGLYETRAHATFRPDETLTVYVEPVGFGYRADRVAFTADLALENADGQVLNSTENVFSVAAPFAAGRREFHVTFSFSVPYIRPGDYRAIFTVHDRNSDKSGRFDVPFSVGLPVADAAQDGEADVSLLSPSEGGVDGDGGGSTAGLSDSDAVAECQRLASDLASEADISAAIDACRVAAARVPTDDLTLYLLGEALNAAGDYSEAVDWNRKAADLGLADAQNALGLKYDAGEGVALDDQEAARLYRLAAEQGLAVAQYNLGLMYDFGEGVQENNAEAVRWYRKAAEQGRADAQNRMGLHYDAGEGVELDDREAVSWYRKAAEQGFAAAQHNLGLMYADGEGVGEDDVEAVVWLRRSAEQGYADAQNALGLKYDLGEGVALDDEEAARWYLRAAEQGLAAAQHNIGLMYDNGEGVPQDEAEAIRWYRLAAEQGHASAQNRLGLKYDSGSGVELDDVEAVKWFRAAADQGLAVAQYNIGLMYDYGEGVARDEAEAVYWLQLSSDQGYADATWTLGQKYLNGTGGLPTDTQRAAEHFLNALRNESGLAHEALVEDRASDLSIRARREVQRALRAEGAYSGLVDGIFDPETVAALERLYEGQ